MRERNRVVNSLLGDYVKGNSRVQLVNIDTGFEQVRRIHNHKHRWNLLATNFVHCAQVQKKPIMPAVSSKYLRKIYNFCNYDHNFTFIYDQVDGSISHHDMFDYVNLTQKGYNKAFEPVAELLTTLLQEMEGEVVRTEAEGAAD